MSLTPKMDTTLKKKARTTRDNLAEDANGGARRDGALVGRGAARSDGQDPAMEHCGRLRMQRTSNYVSSFLFNHWELSAWQLCI